MEKSKVLLLFGVVALVLACALSKANVHGPGHRKGLYGITRRKKSKTLNINQNDTNNKTSSIDTALKSTGMEKFSSKVDQKVFKRSVMIKQNSDRPKFVASKRTNIEVVGDVIKPVSVKEVAVGYSRSKEERDPNNSTQVIEMTGNMTNSKTVLDRSADRDSGRGGAGLEGMDDPNAYNVRSASSNMITDVNILKLNEASDRSNGSKAGAAAGSKPPTDLDGAPGQQLDARTPSSNILTDLKAPAMGQYIHGTAPSSNDSNGNATNASQSSGGNASSDATSRSPQVPSLGASIVGIADNSNNSKLDNRGALSGRTVDEGAKRNASEDESIKLEAFLSDLDEIANSTGETARLVNSTLQEINSAKLLENQLLNNATNSSKVVQKDVSGNKKHEIIGPHYYEPECDDNKKCPDGHYCRMYVCVECHRSKHACTHREQCCNNMECVYGRCESKPKGSPGAFCEKDSECAGEACCVLEPTVDEEHPMCKPKLSEYHQCSPILFRKIWIGDNKPDCGPCKGGLDCVQRGVEGSHEVCMKKP